MRWVAVFMYRAPLEGRGEPPVVRRTAPLRFTEPMLALGHFRGRMSALAWQARLHRGLAPRRLAPAIPNEEDHLPGILAGLASEPGAVAHICSGTQPDRPGSPRRLGSYSLRAAGSDTTAGNPRRKPPLACPLPNLEPQTGPTASRSLRAGLARSRFAIHPYSPFSPDPGRGKPKSRPCPRGAKRAISGGYCPEDISCAGLEFKTQVLTPRRERAISGLGIIFIKRLVAIYEDGQPLRIDA